MLWEESLSCVVSTTSRSHSVTLWVCLAAAGMRKPVKVVTRSLCQPAGCRASPSPGPSMSRDSTPALPTRREEDSAPPASDTLGESGAGAELGEDEKKHVDRG